MKDVDWFIFFLALFLGYVLSVIANLSTPKLQALLGWYSVRSRATTAKGLQQEIDDLTRLHHDVYELSVFGWYRLFGVISGVVITGLASGGAWLFSQVIAPTVQPLESWLIDVTALVLAVSAMIVAGSTLTRMLQTTATLADLRTFAASVEFRQASLRKLAKG